MDANQHAAAWQISERGRSRALLDLVRNRVQLASGSNVFIDPLGGTIGLADLQILLKPNEGIVEFHVLPSRTYAWVIRSNRIDASVIDVKREELVRLVNVFRDAVSQRSAGTNGHAAKLYDLLVRPLGVTAGESLVIVPHDALHYLPFQALRDSDGYFIEKSALSYVTSASALAALLRTKKSKAGHLLAFGNPDLGNPEYALPGAQREVDAIKVLFPDQETYFQKEATKQRLLSSAPGASVVHVAAHAEVDALDPLYSRIFMARDASDRGTLEAREIYPLNLRDVSLVTLSACETGLGKVSAGDEIWGFTRSFLSAGAPALLVSLWPVADESTEQLMKVFYGNLVGKYDARESLRLAQLDVMRDPRFSHPYFWAPFDLIGNWR
jgi:CHAT domain-containing protein